MTSSSPPCVKGTLLLARMKYLQGNGEEATQRVLERLAPAERAMLRGMLLPSSWYPQQLLERLEAKIAAALAKGDRAELFVDMGRSSATTNLTGKGTQRAYLLPGDPHFVLRHSPAVYAGTHTSGERSYEKTGEGSAVLRTAGFAERPNAEECLTTVGWLTRAIELAGGRGVVVIEKQCRARGAPWCEFRCDWRPPLAIRTASCG